MFRRRFPLPFHHRLRDLVWPRAGFRRSVRYIAHRLGRIPGSSYSIACGFAIGAAVSFTPLLGFHLVISALAAWIMRANYLAAIIGTLVGNPWTFPFIWHWIYRSGVWMLGEPQRVHPDAGVMRVLWDFVVGGVNYIGTGMFFAEWDSALAERLEGLQADIFAVIWPMIVGCIPSVILVWGVLFVILKRMISLYQLNRLKRRLAKCGPKAVKSTAPKGDAA